MTSRNAIVLLLIAAAVAASAGPAGAATGVAAPSVEDAVRGLVESGRHPAMQWPDLADVEATLANFYTARSWAPAWLRGGRPTTSAQATIRQLLAASDDGIEPEDLDAARLSNESREMLHAEGTPETRELAEFDVALSADALRYYSALDRGRVSPQRAHADLLIPRPSLDGVGALERCATSRPDTVYATAEPQFVHYQMLLYALARYRAIARGSGLVPLPSCRRTSRPATPIAARRSWRGCSPPRRPERLATHGVGRRLGVRRRARRGRASVPAPHRAARRRRPGARDLRPAQPPVRGRLRAIELGLERWRWLPREYDAPPIFVNVPAFRLYALKSYDDHESEMLPMNVAVGKAYGHRTPLFAESMKYLVFSPYWDVPPSIATKEIRPKALRDASYLAGQNYELVSSTSVVESSHDNIAAIGHSVRVRQRPGPKNALGSVKFIFPNHHNVYLHDTPSGGFDETRRDFSHGCIRVSQPRALAEWVLAGQPEWTPDKITAAMNASRPVQVNLAEPRPVYILYTTAVADEAGRAMFYPDIYELDPPLDQMLRCGFPYPQ
jgi:murein L,D-transpeptidase YcbB/YkuD